MKAALTGDTYNCPSERASGVPPAGFFAPSTPSTGGRSCGNSKCPWGRPRKAQMETPAIRATPAVPHPFTSTSMGASKPTATATALHQASRRSLGTNGCGSRQATITPYATTGTTGAVAVIQAHRQSAANQRTASHASHPTRTARATPSNTAQPSAPSSDDLTDPPIIPPNGVSYTRSTPHQILDGTCTHISALPSRRRDTLEEVPTATGAHP